MREVEIDWRRKRVYVDAHVIVRWDSDIDDLSWDEHSATAISMDLATVKVRYQEKKTPSA
eukprot:10065780-Prorocentrum_lima.AAC.1